MKILLVDTSFAARPIYDYLVGCGHDVWTIGNRDSDLLARRAGGRWIKQDYSDIEAVERHVYALGIERVVPGCTDVSIATCAALTISRGIIDPPETVWKLNDKRSFRQLCAEHDVPAPRAVPPNDLPDRGRLICKPVDAFSGRGISIFDAGDEDALLDAMVLARDASPSGSYLIEEFVDGQLHSCTGYIENGWLTDTIYVIEGSSANPFAVDTSYVRHDIPERARISLEDGLTRLSIALGLVDGLLHTQFILTEDRAYAIECTRRCPGDLYPLLIENSTGMPYADRYASYFIGAPRPEAIHTTRHILRHTVTSDATGIYGGISMDRSVPILSVFPIQSIGQNMLPKQATRCGILFCETDSREQLAGLYRKFMDRRAYDVG
ncbi:hypothetical protein SAMN05443999_105276 [Roseovarius azorensis]|uniref:ATP-grasp domain-containing protein n=1 Tax=Roseovarius azorensis TaxID=1287727 RepID=A0A1H7QIL0_9RHOB|nr:hypothetical protein [Roseovarius azorensis]SEL47425.1 hypothetical protein SAMN05443999_105276 [Roseovarius azorensis]